MASGDWTTILNLPERERRHSRAPLRNSDRKHQERLRELRRRFVTSSATQKQKPVKMQRSSPPSPYRRSPSLFSPGPSLSFSSVVDGVEVSIGRVIAFVYRVSTPSHSSKNIDNNDDSSQANFVNACKQSSTSEVSCMKYTSHHVCHGKWVPNVRYQREIWNYLQPFQPRAFTSQSSSLSRTSRSIPVELAGSLRIDAFGDTGAMYNFMDDSYAMSQAAFVIDRTQVEKITLGSGETVTTTGTARTTCRFSKEKEVFSQIFHLLPQCHHKVILGNRFLKGTKTLTDKANFLRRVVTRNVGRVKTHDFYCIGGSGPAFKGLVNGRSQHALADTGAKLLIMDERYVQELDLTIETGQEHRTRVQFADNTIAMTLGMVYGVSWKYGDDEGEEHMLDFHVLRNAPAQVILSDDFLLGAGTNAFIDHACYMVDEDGVEEYDEKHDDFPSCLIIDIDYSYVNPAIDTREYRDQFETVRYGEEEDWVESLSGDEKIAAQVAVEMRRAQWDPTQPLTGANAMNVVPPQFRQGNNRSRNVRRRLRFWFRKG